MQHADVEVEIRVLAKNIDVVLLDHAHQQSTNFMLSFEEYQQFLQTSHLYMQDEHASIRMVSLTCGTFLHVIDDTYQFQGIVLKQHIAIKDYRPIKLSV